MVIGASIIVPGLSGGTMALVLGIYDQLIMEINGFLSKNWRNHLGFLIPLGLGMVASVFLLAGLLDWLFLYYPKQTSFAFQGLVLGVVPYLFVKSNAKVNFKQLHYGLLMMGLLLTASMIFVQDTNITVISDPDFLTYLQLFFAGVVGSIALILPGLSGSLVLIVLGAYHTILNAVNTRDFLILAVVSLGMGTGIVLTSRLIKYCLLNYQHATYAVVIGLVIGSGIVIFPGWPVGVMDLITSMVSFLIGFGIAFIFGQFEARKLQRTKVI